MNERVRTKIQRAVESLGLGPAQFRLLPREEAVSVLADIEARFVGGADGTTWWWEKGWRVAPISSVHVANGQGFRHLHRLAPVTAGEHVWFVAESGDAERFVLGEGSVAAIQAILGDCFTFEYYLVSQQLDWLVGENHHDVLFAVGEPVAHCPVERVITKVSTGTRSGEGG